MSGETNNRDRAAGEQPSGAHACPTCSTEARRAEARYCSACGRSLEDGYLPADGLRLSYNLETQPRASRKPKGAPVKMNMSQTFSSPHRNAMATTALAFLTYSLVPYLGILFCPGAVLLGGVGLVRSAGAPHRGGRRASYASIILGLVVLCVQLLLWWIIIKVPEWTRPF